MQKKAKSDKTTLYIDPEPGDEKLSPMELEWKYHVPFEGTVFPIRPSPDPEKLRKMREKTAMGTSAKRSPSRKAKAVARERISDASYPTEASGSIMRGVWATIDEMLNVTDIGKSRCHVRRRGSCEKLQRPPAGFDSFKFIAAIHSRIEHNWSAGSKGKVRSDKNWRFEPQTNLSTRNRDPEIVLEKTIARLKLDDWANHVPTSSGLMVDGHADPQRAIDLVRRDRAGVYDFIELKVASDTPLYAAMEIVTYACLYVFSRVYSTELGYDRQQKELLEAKTINLRVLALPDFYNRYPERTPNTLFTLKWLEKAIPAGFREFISKRTRLDPDLIKDFKFEAFPADFDWNPAAPDPDKVKDALVHRAAIYS